MVCFQDTTWISCPGFKWNLSETNSYDSRRKTWCNYGPFTQVSALPVSQKHPGATLLQFPRWPNTTGTPCPGSPMHSKSNVPALQILLGKSKIPTLKMLANFRKHSYSFKLLIEKVTSWQNEMKEITLTRLLGILLLLFLCHMHNKFRKHKLIFR